MCEYRQNDVSSVNAEVFYCVAFDSDGFKDSLNKIRQYLEYTYSILYVSAQFIYFCICVF